MAVVNRIPSKVGPQSLCNRKFWRCVCVVSCLTLYVFCHMIESDLFLYLLLSMSSLVDSRLERVLLKIVHSNVDVKIF